MLMIVIGVLYNSINNRIIKIKEEKIVIRNMPKELDEFKILQISDLHGKEFGKNNKRLIEKINSLDYDILVFTGDIINNEGEEEILFNILRNINSNKEIIWIKGNSFDESDEFVEKLEENGVKYLNNIIEIEKNGKRIFLSDSNNLSGLPFKKEIPIRVEDLSICLTHIPFEKDVLLESYKDIFKYDLVVAGHYHGGQFRIPIIGAIFIPNATGEKSIFPNESEVKGVNYKCTIPQYISTGLGASGEIPILNNRWFNAPEINLITLTNY